MNSNNRLDRSITDTEFRSFQQLLHRVAGIHLSNEKKVLVAGRLEKRLRSLNINNYRDYYRLVTSNSNPDELQVMLDCLTTNETYFFREPDHFDVFQQEVLSLSKRKKRKEINVWSAACSSGEEVYSLAMIMEESLGMHEWKILGSDINQEVVSNARRGHYPLLRIDGIDRKYLKKYCLKGVRSNEGTFLIGDQLKRRTQFELINLNMPLPNIGSFDVIFLRNVMIYFNQETKKEIVQRITQHLKPNGLLFISHSESLHGISHGLKSVRPSVFRKA